VTVARSVTGTGHDAATQRGRESDPGAHRPEDRAPVRLVVVGLLGVGHGSAGGNFERNGFRRASVALEMRDRGGRLTVVGGNSRDMSVESEGSRGGVVRGVRVDVRQLHDAWMELLFPRQRDAAHSVLGRWRPETTRDKVVYWLWAALGVPLIAVLYPLALLGFATRFYSRRFDSAATRLGVVGVVLLAIVVWGALTAVAYVRFPIDAVAAVAAASVVAVVAAGLAAVFTTYGGRATTVLLAYPFAVTAVFLPPVVAALVSPALEDTVLLGSESLAIRLLDGPLAVLGVSEYLRATFDLEGLGYVFMWLAISVPLGWLLGLLVSLANVVRPTADDESADED